MKPPFQMPEGIEFLNYDSRAAFDAALVGLRQAVPVLVITGPKGCWAGELVSAYMQYRFSTVVSCSLMNHTETNIRRRLDKAAKKGAGAICFCNCGQQIFDSEVILKYLSEKTWVVWDADLGVRSVKLASAQIIITGEDLVIPADFLFPPAHFVELKAGGAQSGRVA